MRNLIIFLLAVAIGTVVFWMHSPNSSDVVNIEAEAEKPAIVVTAKPPSKTIDVKADAPQESPPHWQDPEWKADRAAVEKRDNEEKELHAIQHVGLNPP
jgi:hypothetical protein